MPAALIFANGDPADGPMVRRALSLLPDALVIAADGGARTALRFDAWPKAVIGDMDSIDAGLLTALEAKGAVVERHSPQKDETDLELALLYAVRKGADRMRVIGAAGGRLDQTLSNMHLLALPALAGRDVRLVADVQEIWLARPGVTAIEGLPGDTVSLIPLSGPVTGVETDGLFYPLRGESLEVGPARGVSNVMTAERASVRIDAGLLLVMHTLGRA